MKKEENLKIIFLIYRIGYYRYFVPLIREGLVRGYKVECWHDYSAPKSGGKGFAFPYVKDTSVFPDIMKKCKTRIFSSTLELEKRLSELNTHDMVVSIHFPGINPGLKFMHSIFKSRSFKWFTLMSSAPDSYHELVRILNKEPEYRFNEPYFIFSQWWLDMGKKYVKKYFSKQAGIINKMNIKTKIIGIPELDLFNHINSLHLVRKKYGIPQDKSILLYLPFPYNNRNKDSSFERVFTGILTNTYISKNNEYVHNKKKSFFNNVLYKLYNIFKIMQDRKALKYWIMGYNEAKVFRSVRKFCDKNNLFLVVKPRMKFPVAEIIKKKADLIIWDSEKNQNPPIMKELLTIAKLTVSFYSYSVLTSIFAGVPHLNISLPCEFFSRQDNMFWFSSKKYSMFNFLDVCQSWSIKKAIKKLAYTALHEFDMKRSAQKKYIKMINEYNDHRASQRFYNIIERYIKGSR